MGADGIRIAGRAMQHDTKAAAGALIQIQFGRSVVLGNSQVHAPVVVEVRKSRASLFSVNFHAANAVVHRRESPVPASTKPQTPPAVFAGKVRCGSKKVLAQEQVLDSVPVEIADVD